jgi:uncharacterized protein (TIGR02679 family)
MLNIGDEMENLTQEAVRYAKSNKNFNRILKEILVKYKSIGRFSGSIILSNINEEESKILGSIDYKLFGKREGKLSIKKFIDYFCEGRFKGLSFEEFMKLYFKDELTTNKELKEKEEERRQSYFHGLTERAKAFKPGVTWLNAALLEKSYGYTSIIKEYEEGEEKLYAVMKGLSSVSFNCDKLEPLTLFSSRITKDPHFFDIGSTAFRLLVFGLCYHLKESYPQNIEEINEILYSAGIARDEISIFSTIYGMRAFNNSQEHLGWQGFYNANEPLHVSIKNLNTVSSIKINGNKVFIFENPIVFMEVIRELGYKNISDRPALVCTSGQLNTASLMLLDKLFKAGAIFYYSGDFDPEGLVIADNLKHRYKEKLVLWRYSIKDYLKIKGNNSFQGRENKMDKIKNKELIKIKEAIEEEKLCGYQELLIDEYVEDIIKENHQIGTLISNK